MTTNLSVRVGDLELPYPVIPASGVWPYAEDFWSGEKLDGIGALCTKAISMEPRGGNGGVRIWETPSGVLNSIGLQNCGAREFAERYVELVKNCPRPVVANVVMERPAETRETLKVLSGVEGIAAAELNISCPNVSGLSDLQDVSFLSDIVDKLLDLRMYFDEYRPILIKVSPDISHQQLDEIIDYSLMSGVDGIVAGNTTRSRDGLTISPEKIDEIGNGGMSGAPLFARNLELVRYISRQSGGKLPIIGVGGIMSGEQAMQMLDAGASLVEIYSGFIYEGPSLVKRINNHILKSIRQKNK